MKQAALALALCACPALAQAARAPAPIPCARISGGGGEVREISGPLGFKLADGSEVALAELGLPDGAGARSAGDAAREALRIAVLGKHVEIYFEPKPALRQDRHGRRLGQVLVGYPGNTSVWLQRHLVETGAALVDSWATNRACARQLLPLENAARDAEQGLWADEQNLPLPAEEAGEARARFALIEGRIAAAKKLGRTIYLDFGRDWRTGFGVTIDTKAARLFGKAGIDPLALAGALVRVRGYVGFGSGPEIALTHPEMLEVLAPAPPR